MRSFLFKLHNNTLGLNFRVSHFVRNHPRNCTFCTLNREFEDEDETPLHLFFSCPHSEPVVLGTLRWLINNDQQFEAFSRANFFGISNTNNESRNLILQLCTNLIKKYIWDCKTRFSMPNLELCKDFIKEETARIFSHNLKIRKSYMLSGFNFDRE